jgi:tRNA A-37 threonylcarbamoyl transferase component Bud32
VTISTPKPTAAEGRDRAPEDAQPRLAPGTLVAERYRVVSFLDEGGMGAVYRVEHQHMRKAFALKVLHRSLVNRSEIVARFEREAVAAGSIDHPNVAAATDFGRLPDGSFFLILELVQGRSLRDELQAGGLEPDRASKIVRGIVAGVGAAHARGIVHRDLKPENVMLVDHHGDPDFVKVLDFGIAKVEGLVPPGAGGVATPLTQMGAVIGTLEYMSPEQALGNPVDVRSDLYSIGVIFYELLAGQCPFEGSGVHLLQQHVLGEVPSLPAQVVATLDPRVAGIVRKLLAKQPEHRFATAAELAAALGEIAAPRRVVVSPPPPPMPPGVRDRVHGLAGLTRVFAQAPLAVRLGVPALVLAIAAIGVALHGAGDATVGVTERAHGGGPLSSALPDVPSATAVPAAASSLALPPAPAPVESATASPQRRSVAPAPTGSTGAAHRRTGPGGIYIPPPRDWFK